MPPIRFDEHAKTQIADFSALAQTWHVCRQEGAPDGVLQRKIVALSAGLKRSPLPHLPNTATFKHARTHGARTALTRPHQQALASQGRGSQTATPLCCAQVQIYASRCA